MPTKLDPKQHLAILRILRDSPEPIGSAQIALFLEEHSINLHPRTVRLHLERLEDMGLATPATRGRNGGRTITPKGLDEINSASILDRVGMTAAKVDSLAWRMRFDHHTRKGTVVLNISILDRINLRAALDCMIPVFEAGYSMGRYAGVFYSGSELGCGEIPAGKAVIATVCSVTINGILLNHRIPAVSRFGGVLELAESKPYRFTDVIHYEGSSLDPLEVFIKNSLTRVGEACRTGQGRIGVSFREIPTCSLEDVRTISGELDSCGLGGVLVIGKPNQPLLSFPVQEGRTAILINGGLNPVAAVEEAGIPTRNFALSQLVDFSRLLHYEELDRLIR